MKNSKAVIKAIKEVTRELLSMSTNKLKRKLKKYKPTGLSKLFIEISKYNEKKN